jgi:hypothetical protein
MAIRPSPNAQTAVEAMAREETEEGVEAEMAQMEAGEGVMAMMEEALVAVEGVAIPVPRVPLGHRHPLPVARLR